MFTFEPRLDSKETVFKNEVKTKFDLYNSLFLTLPFYQVKNTGLALPYFFTHCEKGIINEQSPEDIIESFFKKQVGVSDQKEITDLLFRFIQYIERQVVLFDAVEDAAYSKIRVDSETSLDGLMNNALQNEDLYKKIQDCLREFKLRLVLTAHPTQFYPGPILSIMTDLTEAIKINDVNSINLLLKQLGKTPFFNKQKPTPVDEALSLNWFLENILYQTASDVHNKIEEVFKLNLGNHSLIELGFWPGGDRDGNPYVTADTTKQVSAALRETLFRCYYKDFGRLKRRITFIGTEQHLVKLESILYANAYNNCNNGTNGNIKEELLEILRKVKEVLINNHDGLFTELVDDFIWKVKLFGCHFASLDIRQDSRVLRNLFKECITSEELKGQVPENYFELTEEEKIKALPLSQADFTNYKSFNSLSQDSLDVIRLIKELQENNGKRACHRFIISNCQKASDILQLQQLFLWSGWKPEELDIDFVPLFETIDDLKNAYGVMDILYSHKIYKKHLDRRRSRQVIMLGFSDSTKDGGYLMANYSIYYAKSTLTDISRKHNIDLAFFDGRGGPPARGGGKTHKFYASFGRDIANKQIQITVQGQTISSYYGTFESSTNNMEQLIHAGIDSALERQDTDTMNAEEKALFSDLADVSYDYFMNLREHPLFLKFMENQSPLKMLSQINIGSRPVKRNGNSELKLEDLRAISFVTSWSQVKMNIPGFYGVGTALKSIKEKGNWDKIKALYKEVGFFKTVIDNCMMSMSKADFRLTQYLAKDKTYGEFWQQLKNEYDLTKELILELSDTNTLMEKNPIDKMSISLREKIVLPLVIIQRYAIIKCTSPDVSEQEKEIYNKLAMRTIYGIINAARNSA
ncbi:Phosphoenolpyruvate carboxylase [Pseudopedobacter saltans DSM 12145]|uniref:Phosphoenolpyruvate carboxylase n=1 Tax=Pseudopedobacter saltans (strain ATCC 51119 / DSM 12145 / JCM 21818 / CCUG 39354 / LMG 10337 / NBRC 100064 / NCIMB 13643) TaxID=762903 RepID=F0SBI4_PSESL|nr:phosphoenolpyruvate carboxylase [Pseudopedobacter saltans]ADY51630.1 Phosphoenolpyruvate carboxylase [Pseudopedobacter saltans DSM 12145]